MRNTLMTPEHHLWDEFVERLEWSEECHRDWRFTVKILKSDYPDVDVAGTLTYFGEHCGRCDCTVLFNIAYAAV